MAFIIVLLFLGLTVVPQSYSSSQSSEAKDDEPPITAEDEGDHFPCGYECWWWHAALTFENGEYWDATSGFIYFMKKTRNGYTTGISTHGIRLTNRQTGEFYDNPNRAVFPGVLQTEKNKVNLTFHNSSAQGLYPDYHLYVEGKEHNITADLNFHAISLPCWLAKESLNCIVPWGFSGNGKAYFVPILEVEGNVSINGTIYNVTGVAYYEHDFVYCNFENPFACYSVKEFLNATKLIRSGARWLLSQSLQNKRKQPFSLHRSNDYLIGWCWSWVIFDNNCSLVFFRPTLFGISAGRVPIFLYFSKDGQNYSEIGNVYWNNNLEVYLERADIYIPLDFEIATYRKDVEFYITFNHTSEMVELYTEDFDPKTNGYSSIVLGIAEGYFSDGEDNVSLNGSFILQQSRWLYKLTKHRSKSIEILLPPYGLGISIRKVSHRLGFERFFKFQLRPTFEFIFYIKPAP